MTEPNGNPRVLVIDDDEKLLGIYEELLRRRGFSVETCTDSEEALPRLKRGSHDVVLLDIRMPGIEGADLLPLIKRLHPELPVIIVSAFCGDQEATYYHTLGAFASLTKPFSHETLLETIWRAMDRQEHIPLMLTSLSLRDGRNQVYRRLILTSLQKTQWNQVRAAELLGVSRYCLMRWMKKLGVTG